MNNEKILSLDISTKTGYAILDSNADGTYFLQDYGRLEKISEPDGQYPSNYVDWASKIFKDIVNLIIKYKPTILVIEETASGSKSAYSQKILEWVHFLLAQYITEHKIKCSYLLTEQWRRITGCIMSKEESKRNKEVKKYKNKNNTNIAYDINGKRIGKITRKHVNIRRANELFKNFLKEPFKRKDEDVADATLLAVGFHMKRTQL